MKPKEKVRARNDTLIQRQKQSAADMRHAMALSPIRIPSPNRFFLPFIGLMQTYWLSPSTARSAATTTSMRSISDHGPSSQLFEVPASQLQFTSEALHDVEESTEEADGDDHADYDDDWGANASPIKTEREHQINYTVEILSKLLKQILARRQGGWNCNSNETGNRKSQRQLKTLGTKKSVLDEVRDIVELPCSSTLTEYTQDPETIELPVNVTMELTDFVQTIAFLYKENPFHSFSHASHVVQSVFKLLTRIVDTGNGNNEGERSSPSVASSKRFSVSSMSSSFGIAADPLTQFTCVLAALIHDLDHPGVPNSVLVNEQDSMAVHYKNKSVAEQNSFVIAWDLLHEPVYKNLQKAIYSTDAELSQFRSLLVNSIMATDIMDKELAAIRTNRWNVAFDSARMTSQLKEDNDRMATIVIEHLIQASDVAHTMQHWHVYVKWVSLYFFCII